jgi:lipopolysaccharide biosynthesis glycosyltransferase
MHVVFCADRRVLPGLHVAAWSLLDSISVPASFHIFSDALTEADLALLRETLAKCGKPFTVELRRVDEKAFAGFPTLNNSLAAYYRLLVPQVLDVDRFLYVDADTLCGLDVAGLNSLPLGGAPAALVPEAPMAGAVDRAVAGQLGNRPDELYFNSGVILVEVAEWRRQRVTERAMEFIAAKQPLYHDQSALNVVLHKNALVLDERFNCITNMRKHWPALRGAGAGQGRLLHFVDYPKPWDLLGEWVNPHYRLWRAALEQTAFKKFRSWHATPARKFPRNGKSWGGYRKSFKDRLLFVGYARGWVKQVKGVSAP